jgi:phage tail sheath gpL-like
MTVPANINLPGAYLNISNVRAVTGLTAPEFDSVFVGQKIAAGTATANEYVQVFSAADAEDKFGPGSMLAEMLAGYFANNALNKVYAIPMDDAGGATATATTLVTTGTATAAGTVFLYINGKQIQVPIAVDDTPTLISTAIVAAITADGSLPVTAVVSTVDAVLTAKNSGTIGDLIDIRFNYNDSDSYPDGISSMIASQDQQGATDPDIADAIAGLPDDVISLFVTPYEDTTNMGKLLTEVASRWTPIVQMEGHVLAAKSGTVSELGTFAGQFNSEFLTIMDAGIGRPTPSYMQAGALAGVMAGSLGADPGRPLQTLQVVGVLPEIKSNRRLWTESNGLIDDGVSAIKVTKAGAVIVDRLCTTYLTNTSGTRDKSYQNTTTMFISSYCRQTLIAKITQTYPRHKLGNDGTRYNADQPVATPKMITGTILGWFTQLEALALVENYEQFKDELVVLRDTNDNDRVNAILPTDYINQFRVFAGEIQFIL